MKPKRLPAAHDIARLVRPTVHETVLALVQHYSTPPGYFSYAPFHRLAPRIATGGLSRLQAVRICELAATDQGRKPNGEVAGLMWDAFAGRESMAFQLTPRDFFVRKELAIPIRPVCYFVERGRPTVLFVQPRKRFGLSITEHGIAASLAKSCFVVDDFEAADIEILDLSVPTGAKQRHPRTFRLSDLALLDDVELAKLMGVFVEAHDIVQTMNIVRPKRKQCENPADQEDLFKKKKWELSG